MVQHKKTQHAAKQWAQTLRERAKKAAIWVSALTHEEWLLSLEGEGRRFRKRVRKWIHDRTRDSAEAD